MSRMNADGDGKTEQVVTPGFIPLSLHQQSGTWTTGLCGCFDDTSNCCITYCCSCITFGQNVEIIDQGNTSCLCGGAICAVLMHLGCFAWLYTCSYRTKLRGQFSLPGDQCGDCCIHYWCPLCALCQEYRELKNCGLDPSIGWVANQKKMQQQVLTATVVAPAFQMGMMR